MKEQIEKLDLRSHDIAGDKLAELLRLFPEIRTEGGKFDFDRLKLALGQAVDVGRERYGMNWPGKAECFKTIQTPSLGMLRPCPEESVNFDMTENLIIEGDNLEVLKLLQKSYLGKVKMIYIDPPYNTGNDFIYPDNYTESLQTYLEYTGQVDAEGRKFGTNTEADGRFHSKWLNMMYPRLYLARNLLRDDGLIFASIDDHEVDNLRKLCNEIFGEENFIATCIWQKRYSRENRELIGDAHDYILVYAKSIDNADNAISKLPLGDKQRSVYKNPTNDPNGPWRGVSFSAQGYRPNQMYEIVSPITGKAHRPPAGSCWKVIESEYQRLLAEGRMYFGKDGNAVPQRIQYLKDIDGIVPWTWWPHEEAGHTDEAKREVQELIGKEQTFDTPKPVRLLKRILQIGTNAGQPEIVIDFFAGTGTTAHAVLEQNVQDSGNRKFILVQLPEPTGHTEYPTIADICKERVRRVIKKLNEEDSGKLDMDGGEKQDRGFRVYKLAESSFTTWDAQVPHEEGTLLAQLEKHVEHIRKGRTPNDILYEVLLKSGFPLTTPVEKQTLAGKTIHSVAGGALVICLDQELTLELIRAIAALKPERVVCLDEGFSGNDQLKANAVQTFKTKGVTSFKTV